MSAHKFSEADYLHYLNEQPYPRMSGSQEYAAKTLKLKYTGMTYDSFRQV